MSRSCWMKRNHRKEEKRLNNPYEKKPVTEKQQDDGIALILDEEEDELPAVPYKDSAIKPAGTPTEEAMELIRENMPAAVKIMIDMLKAEKGVSPLTKVKIIEMMLDRAMGKPEASIHVTTTQQSVEAAQARISAIVSQIRIGEDTL